MVLCVYFKNVTIVYRLIRASTSHFIILMCAVKVLQSENVGHSINWHEGLRAANPTYKSTHSPSVWLTRFAPLLSSYRPRRYCGTWRSEIHLGHVTMFHPQTMVPFGQQPGISRLTTAPLRTLVLMKYTISWSLSVGFSPYRVSNSFSPTHSFIWLT